MCRSGRRDPLLLQEVPETPTQETSAEGGLHACMGENRIPRQPCKPVITLYGNQGLLAARRKSLVLAQPGAVGCPGLDPKVQPNMLQEAPLSSAVSLLCTAYCVGARSASGCGRIAWHSYSF